MWQLVVDMIDKAEWWMQIIVCAALLLSFAATGSVVAWIVWRLRK